ncbi:MAG: hydrogenase expression/formation protein HupK, partial [Rhodobacteraceae bacterium]|nr:hydrogenase expression/formation protein HupK [Paracoccaceae bacterium]
MLDRPDHTRLIARPAKVLPVAQLVRGKRIEEVADLLPRLFNLCRAAQRAAVRAALGLEVTAA